MKTLKLNYKDVSCYPSSKNKIFEVEITIANAAWTILKKMGFRIKKGFLKFTDGCVAISYNEWIHIRKNEQSGKNEISIVKFRNKWQINIGNRLWIGEKNID